MADKQFTNRTKAVLNIDGRTVRPGAGFSLAEDRFKQLSATPGFSLLVMDGTITEGEAPAAPAEEKKPAAKK